MTVLRCDACGGETFEPLSDAGYFKCHNCGASSTVKLASTARGGGHRLVSAGRNKIGVIKVVRECTGWDLRQAKDWVDAADRGMPQSMPQIPGDPTGADRMAEKLAAAGAVLDRS